MCLFHLLEVGILDGVAVVVGIAALLRSGVRVESCALLCASGLLLGIVDVLCGCLKGCVKLIDCRVDGVDVLSLVRFLQLVERRLYGCALVGRELVAEVIQLLFGLEDYGVGLVYFVDALFLFGIGCRIGCRLVFHTLDFLVAQAA